MKRLFSSPASAARAFLPQKKLLQCGGAALVVIFAALWYVRFSPYPAFRRFVSRPVSTRIFDREGALIQILPLENGVRREFVSLSEIPLHVQNAFIEAEDRHFYRHHGIDVPAIFRAAFQNVREGRTVSGASTITMQLSRLITPHKSRNLFSKALETLDALRLEARLSKKQILELYLNNLPFGFNCEGVASASRTFFNTTVDRLSEVQSFCLAVVPRRPASYNPLHQKENCIKAALELCTNPSLSRKEFRTAVEHAASFSYPFEMPHYVRYLTSRYPSEFAAPQVTLSASLTLQKRAENLLALEIERNRSKRVTNGSVLLIENKTGHILAWAGSGDYSDTVHAGQVDGVLSPMQSGSSMKPFLYALALEKNWNPASVLPDIPLEFGFDELYVPQNFNNRYSGPVRFRVALSSSLNVPAVYLLNALGVENYCDFLSSLGFESLKGKTPGLSLALGSEEVTLFELVQAFSVFPRDGFFLPLTPGITAESGAVTTASPSVGVDFATATTDLTSAGAATATAAPPGKEKSSASAASVFDSDTARLICRFLSDESARSTGFGYVQVFQTDYPSMFKTGTANQYQSIVALGATRDYTVGVWMGNFTGETVVGKTGSSIPAKIARELLDYVSRPYPPADFLPPERYVLREICSLSALPAGKYCPSTVFEYTPGPALKNASDTTCTWHRASGVYYPAEYSSWFRLKNRTGSIENALSPLTIVSPREGSVFVYDESLPSGKQQIQVEAIGAEEDLAEVYLDGIFLSTVRRPFVCPVPLSRGEHTVVFSTDTQSAAVSFSVK